MAFYEYKIANGGWTGVESFNSPRQYTVVYQLRSNDPDDGPQSAIAYFASEPGLPSPLQSYAVGNDADALIFLVRITPVFDAGRSSEFDFVWNCTAVWEPIDEQETSEKEDGDPTSNPLEFRRTFDISFAHNSVDATRGLFRRCIKGLNDTNQELGFPYNVAANKFVKPAGFEGAVVNSAGAYYDPPPQKTESDVVLRIGFNVANYDNNWWNFRNTVNDRDIILNSAFFGISNWTFDKWTLRCETIEATFRYVNGVRYWDCLFEFHYRDGIQLSWGERTGWSDLIPDMGFHPNAREGEDDNDGTPIPALVGSQARNRNATDYAGDIITAPVPFDGSGLPEKGDDEYWAQYLFQSQADFSTLPIGFTNAP